MPVLAPLRPFFDAMMASPTTPDKRPVAEARAALHAMIDANFGALVEPRPAMPIEQDHVIPVDGGEIRLRLYAPARGNGPLPCHIYFHGGGFWLGTLDQADATCRAIAADAHCAVVSVDYRLAPEHPFPAAPEDSYVALLWVADNAASLGIDPARISLGGGSAGGNLAAVVALLARDRGGPPLVLQILEIPVTDFTRLEPLRISGEALSIPSGKAEYRAHYLPDEADALNPLASPLLAPDLSGLPPALVMCAEYDALQPEGEAYARRLAEAGNTVEYRNWEGQFHGSQNLSALIPGEAAAYRAQLVDALRRAYGTSA